MRRILPLLLLAAIVLAIGLIASHQRAMAMSNGAPDLQCFKCHIGADKNPADFVVEGLPKKYEPGKIYKITVKITKGPDCSGGTACGGFAAAASAGELIVVDKKDTFISTLPTGQKIITHTKEGSKLREWTFEWKAPTKPVPVKFTISVLAANGDGSFNGDAFATKTFTLEPATAATPTAKPTPTVTVTTKVVTETTETTVTTSTPKTITEHNPMLAAIVAIVIFVIVVGAYLAATRKK